MATVNLPLVPSVPSYRFSTSLDGVSYIVDMYWNSVDKAWYMNWFQIDETPIQYGIKIVLGTLLGNLIMDPAFPTGAMFAIDQTGQNLDATLDDLGTRVIVVYVPAADL